MTPHFPRHQPAGSVVQAQGDGITKTAEGIRDAHATTVKHHEQAKTGVHGEPREPMETATRVVDGTTKKVVNLAVIGGGSVTSFGIARSAYNDSVNRWNVQIDNEPADKQQERYDALSGRWKLAVEDEEIAASESARIMKNPYDLGSLTKLFVAGALPPWVASAFPEMKLTPAQLRELRKNLGASGRTATFTTAELGTPSGELKVQLDMLKSMGLKPTAYAEVLQVFWQEQALEKAGIDWKEWDLAKGAGDLRPIIEKVYEYYGKLYKDNPALEWAGLANLVGPSFAAGFLDLGSMRELAKKLKDKIHDIPHLDTIPWLKDFMDKADKLASLPESEIKYFEQKFLSMQQQIFLDMGASNTAYAVGGIDSIKEMYAAGLFKAKGNPYAAEQSMRAWQNLAQGEATGDKQLLHEAAKQLAYREQHDIIQDDYQQMQEHEVDQIPTGEIFTKMFTLVGQVSVPGTQTMGDYSPTTGEHTFTIDPWGPGKSETTVKVSIPIPTGNVADWDDRWDYFLHDTLPAYTDLLDHPKPGQSMDDIMKQPMHDRIDQYLIMNRIDDLVKDFVEHTDVSVDEKISW